MHTDSGEEVGTSKWEDENGNVGVEVGKKLESWDVAGERSEVGGEKRCGG